MDVKSIVIDNDFAERVNNERLKRRENREQFAKYIGISERTLRDLENLKKKRFSIETIRLIEEKIGCSKEELIFSKAKSIFSDSFWLNCETSILLSNFLYRYICIKCTYGLSKEKKDKLIEGFLYDSRLDNFLLKALSGDSLIETMKDVYKRSIEWFEAFGHQEKKVNFNNCYNQALKNCCLMLRSLIGFLIENEYLSEEERANFFFSAIYIYQVLDTEERCFDELFKTMTPKAQLVYNSEDFRRNFLGRIQIEL